MKITITNGEIENFINALASPESFRNNVSVKVSDALDWAVRVNLKTMNSRYEIYNEARREIGQEFVNNGKVEGDYVKPEFLDEYNSRLINLALLKNELEFDTVSRDDFKGLNLSMPERDFLMLMVDETEETPEE